MWKQDEERLIQEELSKYLGEEKVSRQLKSPPTYYKLYLTLEELYFGKSKKLHITRLVFPTHETEGEEQKYLLTIEIKAGWKAGTKITYEEYGSQVNSKSIAGDIVFVLEEKPHTEFKRIGNDLHKSMPRPPEGVESVAIQTLAGLKLDIPLGLTEKLYRIRGHGMPISKNPGQFGDLFVELI